MNKLLCVPNEDTDPQFVLPRYTKFIFSIAKAPPAGYNFIYSFKLKREGLEN